MTIGFVQYDAGLLLPLAAVALGYRTIVGIAIPMLLAIGLVTVVGIVRFSPLRYLAVLVVTLVYHRRADNDEEAIGEDGDPIGTGLNPGIEFRIETRSRVPFR